MYLVISWAGYKEEMCIPKQKFHALGLCLHLWSPEISPPTCALSFTKIEPKVFWREYLIALMTWLYSRKHCFVTAIKQRLAEEILYEEKHFKHYKHYMYK